jgi:hypothetical protein
MQQEVAALKIEAVQIAAIERTIGLKAIPGIDCGLPGGCGDQNTREEKYNY